MPDNNLDQPLNDGGKKKRMNKAERQAAKHQTAINSFSLSTHSQIVNGYVAGTDRKATDPVFCFVFIAFIIAMIAISIVGFTKGNYRALIAGVDGNQRICGHSPGVEAFPLTYYDMDINSDPITFTPHCVTVCPSQG